MQGIFADFQTMGLKEEESDHNKWMTGFAELQY